jgi:hypothetical protein
LTALLLDFDTCLYPLPKVLTDFATVIPAKAGIWISASAGMTNNNGH